MSYEFQLKRIADALEEANTLIRERMKQCKGGGDSTFTSHPKTISPPSENSSDFASPPTTSKKKKE